MIRAFLAAVFFLALSGPLSSAEAQGHPEKVSYQFIVSRENRVSKIRMLKSGENYTLKYTNSLGQSKSSLMSKATFETLAEMVRKTYRGPASLTECKGRTIEMTQVIDGTTTTRRKTCLGPMDFYSKRLTKVVRLLALLI